MRPRLLDLFCGAGGASMGYHRAGFDVVGVDLEPQPHYPFPFIRADALTLEFGGFDAVHASPPCQRWANGQPWRDAEHPDLITPLRHRLEACGLPWVIENVPRAPLRRDVILCGSQFGLEAGGFEVRRHRVFELSWPFGSLVSPCVHRLPSLPLFGHGGNADFYARNGGHVPAEARRRAMGVEWMNRDEMADAIPPAFTELIGSQLAQYLSAELFRAAQA